MTDTRPGSRRAELAGMGIWVVIPMFRCRKHIADVLSAMPDWVQGIVAVDDKCPEETGKYVVENLSRPNLFVEFHEKNQGVGGAVMTGYAKCVEQGAKIIIKVDGDNQMDLRWMAPLAVPIAEGMADYTKGNRFSSLSHVKRMPFIRLFGNSVLSFMSKVSSGYWTIFDPTNGYTAVHGAVAKELLTRKIAKRYFFESDMLYHLGSLRAVVRDIAMPAIYEDEESNLSVRRIVIPFLYYHARNTVKRFIGHYLVRSFSVATLETLAGVALVAFGASVAIDHFASRADPMDIASPGIVMLSALPIMLGVQFLLSALNFDVLNVPNEPIHPQLALLNHYLYADDEGQ